MRALPKISHHPISTLFDTLPNTQPKIDSGAGSGNRTRMISLEGWSSTIELYPQKQPSPRLNQARIQKTEDQKLLTL